MKFIHRLGYYLGGFAIGLIILMFFLNGKDASCDYGPNARTVKNISSKPLSYSESASTFIQKNTLDSLTVVNLIKYGTVDFSKSNIDLDSCKIYIIENSYKEQEMELKVENCNSLAKIIEIDFTQN
ncbi:hypothetical protein [Winogradskyella sp. SYSU M77433]|uniref:hypothetical protein n=1 Tax=Winogradskyella sp. SYSU M77433 TaxID=3042722 RepID=UPI0024814572|nr:hypothetical protein [Winogradskyella sp. SYSU M77433]MDH7913947.1 hypothetical protein [Winogradskyella sp. SYSU M77433]